MKVVAVVGARLNSSRLPRKHLLDLAGEPVIARIFERLEAVSQIDEIILATTADDYNQMLIDWGYSAGKNVFSYQGDVNDLVSRVSAALPDDAGIIVYVCGDSPLVEPEVIGKLVDALQANNQAETAQMISPDQRESIHEGFAVYRYGYWLRLADAADTSECREHIGLSARKLFPSPQIVHVEDDPVYSRIQHRLSVDTPTDYEFMSEIYERWYRNNSCETLVSLKWVIEQLEQDSELRNINASVRQRAVSDRCCSIWYVIVPSVDDDLEEHTAIIRKIQDRLSLGVELWIVGKPRLLEILKHIPHLWMDTVDSVVTELLKEEAASEQQFVIVDMPEECWRTHAESVASLAGQPSQLIGLNSGVMKEGSVVDGMNWCTSESLLPFLQSHSANGA